MLRPFRLKFASFVGIGVLAKLASLPELPPIHRFQTCGGTPKLPPNHPTFMGSSKNHPDDLGVIWGTLMT